MQFVGDESRAGRGAERKSGRRQERHGARFMKEINSELPASGYEIWSGDLFPHCDWSNGPRYYPRGPRTGKQTKEGAG